MAAEKDESEPITDDEWLLRRVARERFVRDRVPEVSPTAFEPRGVKAREPDHDGISLYRAACLEDAADVLAATPVDRRLDSGIVRLRVGDLKALGITVLSLPAADIRGHVVLPEVSTGAMTADRLAVRGLMKQLAELASTEVVQRPG